MYIGYARVSTQEQHLDLQQDALRQAGCTKIIVDRVSGTVPERPGLVKLKDRHGRAELPEIGLIDMKTAKLEPGNWLSEPLAAAVAETLASGDQALLFLNRRGYAPLTLCRACGHPYHLTSSPPKRAGVCDTCGGELYQREDDREDTVRNRLEVYRRQTAPLLDYYRQRNLLVTVPGEGAIAAIRDAVRAAVGAER